MSVGPVRVAYSAVSEQYIDLSTGGWQGHEGDRALIRRHLIGLAGPVLDLGCGPGHGTAFLHAVEHSVAGILAWYSTIHMPLSDLKRALAMFGQLPACWLSASSTATVTCPSSITNVTTAYRWPVDVFAEHLAAAGLWEVQRLQHHGAERPDRKYAAIAARPS